ncbi:MAG TPA: M20/M25/M40 family metallo-hydrolase [Fimbriimonadaceae bacterium]|nr:M20/M25/M40 family metallo-hydrolase [Fimbriimonadaceae bacterium]
MVNETRLVELFKQLVLINAPSFEEQDCVAFVKNHLIGMGLEVWEDDAGAKIGGKANNLIAKLPANKPGLKSVFLSAHFDTVEPTEGLIIEEKDGFLYSASDTILGADDKGGMAPAIEALQVLLETSAPHGDIYLLFSVCEEGGLKGAAALDIQSLDVDFGFVLDTGPPVGTFVTRTSTNDRFTVTITGKPAHAGKDPEKGINAIMVAASAIEGMPIGRIGPETTSNLGIISGGTGVNVVCPEVVIKGEARSTSLQELEDLMDTIIKRFQAAGAKWGAQVHIDHRRDYGSYELSPDAEVVKIATTASRNLGFEPALRTTLGGSDANIYNAKGVPTIVVATGMDLIHTHEERISRKELVDTTRLVLEILRLVAES